MGRKKKTGSWKDFKKVERVLGRLSKSMRPVTKPILRALTQKAVGKIGNGKM
jgi:hypothetical protein